MDSSSNAVTHQLEIRFHWIRYDRITFQASLYYSREHIPIVVTHVKG